MITAQHREKNYNLPNGTVYSKSCILTECSTCSAVSSSENQDGFGIRGATTLNIRQSIGSDSCAYFYSTSWQRKKSTKDYRIASLVIRAFVILFIIMEIACLFVLCQTSNKNKKNSTGKKWSTQLKQRNDFDKTSNPSIQIYEIPIDSQEDFSDMLPLNLSTIMLSNGGKHSTDTIEPAKVNDEEEREFYQNNTAPAETENSKNTQQQQQLTPTQAIFDNEELEDVDDDFEVEEFYSKNPVDQKATSASDFDVDNEIKVPKKDFTEFDDTEKFYQKKEKSGGKSKTSNNIKKATGVTNTTKLAASKRKKVKQNSSKKAPELQTSINVKVSDVDDKLTNDANHRTKRKKAQRQVLKQSAGSSKKTSKDEPLSRYKPAEANVYVVSLQQAAQCAMVLRSGGCLTFAMIEWAIRRARQALRFRRPENLDSSELDETTIHQVGELVEVSTRILAEQAGLGWEELAYGLEGVDVRQTSLWDTCPQLFRWPPACRILTRYRTHTGQCNNPLAGYLGSTNTPLVRLLPPDYADGVGVPRRSSLSGGELPPVRLLALSLHPDIENASPRHSVLFMSWGQLLNHDISRSSGARAGTGQTAPCCQRNRERTCMPFEIGADDPLYSRYGIRCHEFKRSLAGLRPGCSFGPRTQFNTVTSFLDASHIYGSTRSMSGVLRAQTGGLLRVWDYFEQSRLLPLMPPQEQNPDEECIGRRDGLFCFLSGDLRTNQQIQLAALHTVHLRQHNRLAGALARLNPHWSDNKLYHEARHIHIALIQHIVLNEYLPALLGPALCAKFNLTESPLYWDHYDPTLNPGVSQAFSAAAFRQGHSTVPNQVFRFNNQHEPVRLYQLRQLYRQPWALFEPGAMDEFLLGMLTPSAQTLDPFIGIDLSGHLLKTPNEPVGLDLTAINIQRGRDQGVAGYNAFRALCGLGRARSFQELDTYMSNRSAQLMAVLYETVDDIDLFTGGISEFPLDGAQVGPTFACIIGHQFHLLRSGDRMWFETSMAPQAFTVAQLASIKQVSLARIICANSDNIVTIQQMALLLPHPILNPRLFCDSLPDLDITLWYDPVRPVETNQQEETAASK